MIVNIFKGESATELKFGLLGIGSSKYVATHIASNVSQKYKGTYFTALNNDIKSEYLVIYDGEYSSAEISTPVAKVKIVYEFKKG